MSNKSLVALIVAVVVGIVAWNSFYIVSQTERAVLLRFGRVVQADVQPGDGSLTARARCFIKPAPHAFTVHGQVCSYSKLDDLHKGELK